MVARDISPVESAVADDRGATILGSIFGAADAHAVVEQLDRFCRAEAGSAIRHVLSCELSVGAAFGLELRDGARIAVKLHDGDRAHDYLQAVREVQAALAADGFPCPRPVGELRPLGAALAAAEEHVDGELADGHDPHVRGVMARSFHALVRTATRCPAGERLPVGLGPARGSMWPPAPNSEIAFTATCPEAAEIDAVGMAARRVLDGAADAPLVVGHCDWSVKNLRFRGGELSAAYDWDSLYRAREETFVGVAAATFPATWYLDVVRAPSPDEARAFVADYDAARATPFTEDELAQVAAACTYWIAYNARCELALDPAGLEFRDHRRLLASIGPEGLRLRRPGHATEAALATPRAGAAVRCG